MPSRKPVNPQYVFTDDSYFVYALVAPDKKPFYIGSGIPGRPLQHFRPTKKEPVLCTHLVISFLRAMGLQPGYRILDVTDNREDAYRLEREYIKKAAPHTLVNIVAVPAYSKRLRRLSPIESDEDYVVQSKIERSIHVAGYVLHFGDELVYEELDGR